MKRMKYLSIIILLVALLFISCKKTNTTTEESIIQSATIVINTCNLFSTNSNSSFSVCYDSLLRDSRCQEPVLCIWKGEVSVKLLFKQNNNTIPFKLSDSPNITGNPPNDTTINGVHIKLVDVFPYRFINSNAEKKIVLEIN
jgi:hypothetical protein